MNNLSKKLRDLEGNVLELPEDDNIRLYIDNDAENTLHERANNIKKQYKNDVKAVMFNPNATFEQIEEESQKFIKTIPESDLFIINESHKFVQ